MPNEAYYSKRMIDALKEAGIACHKTSERYAAGVPDIYVSGGNWIETKKVPLHPGKGNTNVMRHFSTNQINFMKRYTAAGDLCLLFIIFYDSKHGAAQYYLLAPFQFVRKFHFWTIKRLEEWAFPTYAKINFSECFDKTQPNNRNQEGIDEYLAELDGSK